jgi:eukaryotic-like serine/threonine-protein kinase
MSDWQQVQNLFLDSVDLPASERAAFLERSCQGNPELFAEIESLVAADLDSGQLIDSVVQLEAARLFDSQILIGERLGIYRIVREIGRGGMGSVYLAIRDDEEFRKEVALKIVKRGMDTAEVLQRFRYERQILADLEHPYIARLFDGGSTKDGVPFFVMEYVQGRPVDVFCRENALDVNACCELFIRILEAVAYAHRSLVVHRDLKPANILVTADGAPKLLDFGVAKLISGDPHSNRTLTAAYRPFTPGYASPEQVRGLPITTATDIYSLGAILYEVLSGQPAYKITVHTPAEIENIVCTTEIPRPSLHKRGLSSDLDNIALMAMSKEPERRYQSADQFAEDLRHYLQGRPVIARQDSLHYQLGKFIRRHRLQVAAAAIVAASLVAGLAISLAQARRAETARRAAESQRIIAVGQTSLAQAEGVAESQQRIIADQQRKIADSQRDEAQHQKALADQRVKDILQLANRTLFDVHDAIETLPGSMAARRIIVKTTLDYLEGLQREAGMDDQMREALCAAYYKIGMIQGNPQGASLQDFQGSETSLLKGEKILMPAYDRNPNDPDLMMRLIEIRSGLATLMYRSGRQEQGIHTYLDLLPLTQRLAKVKPCSLLCEMQEPILENSVALELLNADPTRALEYANRGIAIMRDLRARYPDDASVKQALGSIMAAGATANKTLGNLDKASEDYRESITAREELLSHDPNDYAVRRNLMIAYGNYALLLGIPWSVNLDRPQEARIYTAKAAAMAREMVAADANDATARHDLGVSLGRVGMVDPEPGRIEESLASLEEARKLIEPIAAANAKSAETANQLALILQYEGHRQREMGRSDEALASARRSIAVLQPFFDQKKESVISQYLSCQQSLALLEASIGDHAAALDLGAQGIDLAEEYSNTLPRPDSRSATMAEAWSILAVVQSKAGLAEQARQSANTAGTIWNSITRPGVLSAHRRALADIQIILNLPGSQ